MEENKDIDFPITTYKVYAKINDKKQVTYFYSTCFKEPQEDIFIKSGLGDEFTHVGYYQVYDENMCHNYKIVDKELIECTNEEKELELKEIQNNTIKKETLEEKINRLQEELNSTQDLLIMISNNEMEV